MGIWSGNSNVGNIFGYYIGYLVITKFGWGWEYALITTAGILFLNAFLLIIFLKTQGDINTNEIMNRNFVNSS